MKCKNCDNELTGRQQGHCSDRCRMALKRTQPEQVKVEHETRTALDANAGPPQIGRPDLEHYQSNPEMYATRTNPEKLNWGPWLGSVDLKARSFVANRVSIPGDWDYKGVG